MAYLADYWDDLEYFIIEDTKDKSNETIANITTEEITLDFKRTSFISKHTMFGIC